MSSKRRHEGYLLIDNRYGPGVTAEFVRASGKDAPIVPEGAIFESPTYTCSHCHGIVILNPDRSRERHYCRRCDHYICDVCATVLAQTLECVPLNKVFDLAQEAQTKSPIVLP